MVGVDLDVLVVELLFFESDPDALHERAKPSREKFQGMFCGVGLLSINVDVSVAHNFRLP